MTFDEVAQAFHDSVSDDLAFCAERGEPPDRPRLGSPDLERAPPNPTASLLG
jgi:predicted HicB family RNase H-like nuclease